MQYLIDKHDMRLTEDCTRVKLWRTAKYLNQPLIDTITHKLTIEKRWKPRLSVASSVKYLEVVGIPFFMDDERFLLTQDKKWSFPLRISPVNVTKSAVSRAIWSHLLRKSLLETSFFVLCGTLSSLQKIKDFIDECEMKWLYLEDNNFHRKGYFPAERTIETPGSRHSRCSISRHGSV